MRLFLLGATGGTGRELVDQALRRQYRMTAYVRTPHKLAPRDRLTVVQGDLLNVQAVTDALAGHDAVLSAVGPPGPGQTTIMRDSAKATVMAMKSAGVRRLLILGVAMLFDDAGILARLLRKIILRNIANDAGAMELVVRRSGLDWTIVRPPRLMNGPLTGRYAIADGCLPNGAGRAARISRADVAHFLLDEAERPAHVGRVVGIA